MYSKINRNIYKPPVAEATKEIVRKNFTREIEFFEFCKQRLHKQYLALNLNENQPWNTNGFKKRRRLRECLSNSSVKSPKSNYINLEPPKLSVHT